MTDEHQDPDSVEPRPAASVLDSHVHFWDPRGGISYPWLKEAPPLDRPFLPDDFAALRSPDSSAIFVEAGRAEEHADAEVEWVRDQAERHPWIVGAVAHVRLEDPQSARATVRRYAEDPFVVGVRRNLQDEAPGFLVDPALWAGVRLLGEAGLPFDACVREHQMPELVGLATACPQTTIVLDHLGKPSSAAAGDTLWRHGLRRLADHDNVVCKLSGLATELSTDTPRDQTVSLLLEAIDLFGTERCLYGGDWPVMTLATSYDAWLGVVREALAEYPASAAEAVMSRIAQRLYRPRAASTA